MANFFHKVADRVGINAGAIQKKECYRRQAKPPRKNETLN
jgi:hypothetical protein